MTGWLNRPCSVWQAEGNYGQRLLAATPQPVHRVLAQQPGQPGAPLPAGRQDHLVIVVGAGLGAHRLQQVAAADDVAGLAADPLQVPHYAVRPVFCGGTDVDRLTRKVYWLFRAAGLPPIASHPPHASWQLETRSSSHTQPARRRGVSATDTQRLEYAAQLRYALVQLPDGLGERGVRGSRDLACDVRD